MSEQRAVPEIPEDLREMYEFSKLDTTMFVGSQIRQLIRRITNLEAELAELRATDHTVQMEETADAKAERKKYEALREERDSWKSTVESIALMAGMVASETWGVLDILTHVRELREERDALKATVARLSAPVSDAEWLDDLCAGDHVQFADLQRHEIDRFIAARTTPPAKEPK